MKFCARTVKEIATNATDKLKELELAAVIEKIYTAARSGKTETRVGASELSLNDACWLIRKGFAIDLVDNCQYVWSSIESMKPCKVEELWFSATHCVIRW